jgi:hypothetical protein
MSSEFSCDRSVIFKCYFSFWILQDISVKKIKFSLNFLKLGTRMFSCYFYKKVCFYLFQLLQATYGYVGRFLKINENIWILMNFLKYLGNTLNEMRIFSYFLMISLFLFLLILFFLISKIILWISSHIIQNFS